MEQERTQREQTRHSGGRETGAGSQGPQHGSPDYQVLLSRYGEAMLKISQLEDQVSHLTGLLQDGVAQGSQVSGSRVETGHSPASPAGTPSIGSTFAAPRAGGVAETQHVEVFHHMRLQISNLENQLANTKAELREIYGQGSRRRRRKDRNKRWWTKLARGMGRGESQRS